MRFNSVKLQCLFLVAIVVFITQQVSGAVVGVEQQIDPRNVPKDYDARYEPSYMDVANYYDMLDESGNVIPNNGKRSSRIHVFRRGCIPRGGACDNRPNDCCYNSSCRCNLWGSNCRCQRMGLFQKWG